MGALEIKKKKQKYFNLKKWKILWFYTNSTQFNIISMNTIISNKALPGDWEEFNFTD